MNDKKLFSLHKYWYWPINHTLSMCWQGRGIQMQSTGQAVPETQSGYRDPAAYSALSIIFLRKVPFWCLIYNKVLTSREFSPIFHCFSTYDNSLNLSLFLLGIDVNTSSSSNPGHIDSCVPGTSGPCTVYRGQHSTAKMSGNKWQLINIEKLRPLERRTATTREQRSREMTDVLTKQMPRRTQQGSHS